MSGLQRLPLLAGDAGALSNFDEIDEAFDFVFLEESVHPVWASEYDSEYY